MTEKPGAWVPRKIPRAQVLAFIALNASEVQMPEQIRFREYLYQGKTYRVIDVDVDDQAAVEHWRQVFNLPDTRRDQHSYTDSDGHRWTRYQTRGRWRGFTVEIEAAVPDAATTAKNLLDEATREQLQQLADEPASLLASGEDDEDEAPGEVTP